MIWIILAIIIAACIGIHHYKEYSVGEGILSFVFFGIFLCGFSLVPAFFTGSLLSQKFYLCSSTQLVALKDKDTASGSFFLGCGSINGETNYYYYTKDASGAMFPGKSGMYNVWIKEEDREDGEMNTYKAEFVDKSSNWFGFCFSDRVWTEFKIPKGSLKQEFKLNQ